MIIQVLVFSWLGSSATFAEPQPVDASANHLRLSEYVDAVLVPPGGPGWPEVQHAAFAPNSAALINLGLTPNTWWGRFSIRNPTSAPLERWLAIDHPTLDEIRLLEVKPDGSVTERRCGLMHPASARDLHRRTCTFRLQLEPGATQQLYLSVHSENELVIPLEIWSLEALTAHDYPSNTLRHILWGFVLALVLTNLLLFAFSRERSSLLYALGVSCILAWCITLDGTFHLLVPDAHLMPRLPFALFSQFSGMCSALFVRTFLKLPTERPSLDRWVRLAPVLTGLNLGAYALGVPWRTMNLIGMFMGVGLALCWFALGTLRWREGLVSARYLVAGWSGYLLAYIGGTAIMLGVWTSADLTLIPLVASAIEVLFLAVALADDSYRRTLHITRLQDASTRFVPSEFLRLLGYKELPEVRVGQQVSRTMTVWFSDVRSFTTIVEGLTPAQTMELVNAYLMQMEPIITRNGGVIDKYIGDAVMALFETPDAAVKAAHEAVAALAQFNQATSRPIRMGVGLHTGRLVLGVVGSDTRLSCTVLGDSVNLASRIEGLTRTYGAEVLCTESTVQALASGHAWHFRELDRVQVKGKGEQVTIFQLLESEPSAPTASVAEYSSALAQYRQGHFAGASALFEQCLQKSPGDAAAELMLRRSQAFQRSAPTNWDGVMRLDHK